MVDSAPPRVSTTVPLSWFAAFGGALALVGIGLALGEAAQVLMNARDLCLACLGVG